MYHSIIFQKCNSDGTVATTKNTWDDWHLVPSSRPVFSSPKQKTRFLDIPGADGFLDMSDSLTGYPIFENRQGSFEFIVINESDGLSSPGTKYGTWSDRYTEIMEFLHGKVLRAILEDDIDYFYEGRFSVNGWASEEARSKITIDYSVKPYKYSTRDSLLPNWLWDELDFNDDHVTNLNDSNYADVAISSTNSWTPITIRKKDIGVAPTCPIVRVSNVPSVGGGNDSGILFKLSGESDNKARNLINGDHKLPDVVLFGEQQYTFEFKGTGVVSILFREGRM